MRNIFLVLLNFIFIVLFFSINFLHAKSSIILHVSPDGNEKGDGSRDKPFGNLNQAVHKIRAFKNNRMPEGNIEVLVHEGIYFIKKCLELDKEDSGTSDAMIVFKAAAGEEPVFVGGVVLQHSWFRPVNNLQFLNRIIEKSIRSKILVADLKAHNIKDFGVITRHGWNLEHPDRIPPAHLYVGGKRMTLARWPNEGVESEFMEYKILWPKKYRSPKYKKYTIKMDNFVKNHIKIPGMVTYTEVIDPGPVCKKRNNWWKDREFMGHGGTIKVNFDRMKYWNNVKDIWIDGVLSATWEWTYNRIAFIDTVNKTITLAYGELNGLGTNRRLPHFYFENIPEEIDTPGEYYIDRSKGLLYLYPPKDFSKKEIILTTLKEPMVKAKGIKYVKFKGLNFSMGRNLAFEMDDCENVIIDSCTISNFTKGAIKLTGKNNAVINSHIYGIGGYGIYLNGGNRKTLEPGNNLIKNCLIHDFGWEQKSQIPGVYVQGVGNQITHCEFYDAPHFAIRMSDCNDIIVEYNEIHHLPNYHKLDGGAVYIYTGPQPECRGNVIRQNYFHHIPTNGVYADNFTWGVLIEKNIFYKVGNLGFSFKAVNCNGGGQNMTINNIMIDCNIPYGQGARPKEAYWLEHFYACIDKFGNGKVENTPYNKYSDFKIFLSYEEPEEFFRPVSFVEGNLFFNNEVKLHPDAVPGKGIVDHSGKLQAKNNWYTEKDPGFVDYLNKDFSIKENALIFDKIKGFELIDFHNIGIKKNNFNKVIK